MASEADDCTHFATVLFWHHNVFFRLDQEHLLPLPKYSAQSLLNCACKTWLSALYLSMAQFLSACCERHIHEVMGRRQGETVMFSAFKGPLCCFLPRQNQRWGHSLLSSGNSLPSLPSLNVQLGLAALFHLVLWCFFFPEISRKIQLILLHKGRQILRVAQDYSDKI